MVVVVSHDVLMEFLLSLTIREIITNASEWSRDQRWECIGNKAAVSTFMKSHTAATSWFFNPLALIGLCFVCLLLQCFSSYLSHGTFLTLKNIPWHITNQNYYKKKDTFLPHNDNMTFKYLLKAHLFQLTCAESFF